MRKLIPDPFLAVLLLTILLATLFPVSGDAAGQLSFVATAAIVVLFFLHGIRLPREHMVAALGHWRLHLTILATTFVVFPLLGLALVSAFPNLLPRPLWVGMLFLCALPSTVQSSIAFTSMARGNVAGTVASAAASNLLGIALTPVLIGLLAHAQTESGSVSFAGVWKIVLQLLLPFALGHLLRPWLGHWAARQRSLLSYIDRGTIVLAVYSAFSAAVIAGIWQQVPIPRLLILAALCAGMLTAILLITRGAARLLGFSPEDEISLVFCGSQKSLVSGVPMARVLFAGPAMGAAILPVMIFHQMQLMTCAWLARRYAARQGGPQPGEHR
ncbi:MAG TPA: bile acid:sodium symporter family protein [Steroidobacteraceae bacterium]|nr:bile acid:sodium symporter family protein [Steroidobacteraceae bacterium]